LNLKKCELLKYGGIFKKKSTVSCEEKEYVSNLKFGKYLRISMGQEGLGNFDLKMRKFSKYLYKLAN
jgi:hypothetical protein